MKRVLSFVLCLLTVFSIMAMPMSAFAAGKQAAPKIKVVLNTTSDGFTISWNKVAKANKYRVYRSTDQKTWATVATTSNLSCVDTKVESGKTYYYKAKTLAANSLSVSNNSNIVKKEYAARPYMGRIIVMKKGCARVNWYPVVGAKYYEVQRKGPDGKWTKLGVATGTTYNDKKATGYPDTKYQYRIRCLAADKATYISGFSIATDIYTCVAVNTAACREKADNSSKKLATFKSNDKIAVIGKSGNYYKCVTPAGKIGYVAKNNMSLSGEIASVKRANGETWSNPYAVDLRAYLPDAEFSITFANASAKHNPAKESLYAPVPLLTTETAKKLKVAYEIFEEKGYRMKIYDAYRPLQAQYDLWEALTKTHNWKRLSQFLADPQKGGSFHQGGWAVDMSLIDKATGKELKMPTDMHEFGKNMDDPILNHVGYAKHFSVNPNWTSEEAKNVALMSEVMQEAGFELLQTEWWHFQVPTRYRGSAMQNTEAVKQDLMLDTVKYK